MSAAPLIAFAQAVRLTDFDQVGSVFANWQGQVEQISSGRIEGVIQLAVGNLVRLVAAEGNERVRLRGRDASGLLGIYPLTTEFAPGRLVGWMQDELQRFNVEAAEAAAKMKGAWEPFTLHDFRRTAITGMQMAGNTEKETSIAVGCTPEVMRKHYEKLDQLAIAKRMTDRRLASKGEVLPFSHRACSARPVDKNSPSTQTVTA